jgi:hypothetical protein
MSCFQTVVYGETVVLFGDSSSCTIDKPRHSVLIVPTLGYLIILRVVTVATVATVATTTVAAQ